MFNQSVWLCCSFIFFFLFFLNNEKISLFPIFVVKFYFPSEEKHKLTVLLNNFFVLFLSFPKIL